MRRRLISLSIALSVCVAVSVAGADVRQWFSGTQRKVSQSKEAQPFIDARTIDARTYRSPGRYHKVVIESGNGGEGTVSAKTSEAAEIADYGSFKLAAIDQAAVDEQRSASSSLKVRDDLNLLFLRSGAIDTTSNEAPGEFLGLGGSSDSILSGKTAVRNGSLDSAQSDSASRKLRLVQFIGPVKREWLDRLRASGVELVAYLPNNAYLVYGNEAARSQLLGDAQQAQTRGKGFVQWEGPFLDHYKIHPSLAAAEISSPNAEITVAVQIARLDHDRGAGAADDARAARKMALSTIGDAYQVLGFTNLKIRIRAGRIASLAALANVVNVEPWVAPVMLDERAAQIGAGALTGRWQAAERARLPWLAAVPRLHVTVRFCNRCERWRSRPGFHSRG
jgi:hypothetical protein